MLCTLQSTVLFSSKALNWTVFSSDALYCTLFFQMLCTVLCFFRCSVLYSVFFQMLCSVLFSFIFSILHIQYMYITNLFVIPLMRTIYLCFPSLFVCRTGLPAGKGWAAVPPPPPPRLHPLQLWAGLRHTLPPGGAHGPHTPRQHQHSKYSIDQILSFWYKV